jgi:phosphate/phosphite/phosphonate ABC transporter binding protein
MKKSIAHYIALSLITLFYAHISQAADLKIAVNAPRGALDTQKWTPLMEQLVARTGKTIEVVAYMPSKIDEAIANGEVDFGLLNPVSTVIVTEKFQAKPLATVKANGTPFLAGVIFAKKGNGITKPADLKGKRVASFNIGSAAGAYVFQTYHLMQQGIDPHKDFSEFKDMKKQDAVVLAVQLGMVDAGFVRSGILESMAKERLINLKDFVIIDKKKDQLKALHSTSLYPEWFLVAAAETDATLIKKVHDAAMNIKPEHAAAKTAEIDGFVEAQNLDGLRKALKALKLPPYEGG